MILDAADNSSDTGGDADLSAELARLADRKPVAGAGRNEIAHRSRPSPTGGAVSGLVAHEVRRVRGAEPQLVAVVGVDDLAGDATEAAARYVDRADVAATERREEIHEGDRDERDYSELAHDLTLLPRLRGFF